jgi:hypothetical protein
MEKASVLISSAANHVSKIGFCAVALMLLLLAAGTVSSAQTNGSAPLSLDKAIGVTELPQGAWGPYSRMHSGLCYLQQRFPFQLLSFPVVVGQKRSERVRQLQSGGSSLLANEMILRRRIVGTSPAAALSDDRAASSSINRLALPQDADLDGLLWTYAARFDEAPAIQAIPPQTAIGELPRKAAPWGAAHVTLTYLPAFADNADGILIRVELENLSKSTETFYIDQLAGLDTITERLSAAELVFDPQPDSASLVMHHHNISQAFAVSARGAEIPPAFYTVDSSYFSEPARQTPAERAGPSHPYGELVGIDAPAQGAVRGRWGLVRLDDITLEPGKKRSVWLSIGVNADATAAVESARTLLKVAEDNPATEIKGAYPRALEAHQKAVVKLLPPGLSRLAAASLLCTPANGARRLAAPSRLTPDGANYSVEFGAMEAFAWLDDRPDRSAAQLNAWFAVLSNPDAPLSKTHARPALDLFVLWQLYQRDNNLDLLKRVYPYARRRYQELLAGCAVPGSNIPGWPTIDITKGDAGVMPGKPDIACASFIASQAMLLSRIAVLIGLPDRDKYRADAAGLTAAIRAGSVTKVTTPEDITHLFPLLAGSSLLTPAEVLQLTKELEDEGTFLSRFGLRSLSAKSAGYRPSERRSGGIDFRQNWQLIAALLDCGRAAAAAKITDRLLAAYAIASANGTLPEWLNADTSVGNGLKDWCGDSCALIWLQRHFDTPGAIAAGSALEISGLHYTAASDNLEVTLRCFEESPPGCSPQAAVCMARANTVYSVAGDFTARLVSDAHGRLYISAPSGPGKVHITVTPAHQEPAK